MIAFFNLWSNWGATLYGEVRGASDFQQEHLRDGGALITTSIAAIIFFLLISKTMGSDFYNSANNAFWSGSDSMGGVWPYPVTLAIVLHQPVAPVHRHPAHVALVLRLGGDRVPDGKPRHLRDGVRPHPPREGGAGLSKSGVPYYAILIMFVPSLVIAYFYAYSPTFF